LNKSNKDKDELISQEILASENPETKKPLATLPDQIDHLVKDAVFGVDSQVKKNCRCTIREIASTLGIVPASIQNLYEAAGKGLYHDITVPAINIRGITYYVARAVFRAALKTKVGAFIFEINPSEIGYTAQRPDEYVVCILAAAIREGFKGPIFIQGDHFQVNQSKYSLDPEKELSEIKELIRESISAGFLNIDIDASTLVDLEQQGLDKQQKMNCLVTADMTSFIRGIQPEGITISVGGEIGEVGKVNSTVQDLMVFMAGYLNQLNPNVKGISKISVQTGATHGGVVLPDGSISKVKLDFKTLKELSKLAREEYGMGGAVQHGASTLPSDMFDMFPQTGTLEVHMGMGFQNLVYDNPYFPKKLLNRIYKYILENYTSERKQEDTAEQFLYKNRGRAFGDLKKEIWSIPEENLTKIMTTLENRFSLIFKKLNTVETVDLVNHFVINS